MCANLTCSSVLAVSAPTVGRVKRPALVRTMIVMIEAFREALDMRRAAQRSYFLGDE